MLVGEFFEERPAFPVGIHVLDRKKKPKKREEAKILVQNIPTDRIIHIKDLGTAFLILLFNLQKIWKAVETGTKEETCLKLLVGRPLCLF